MWPNELWRRGLEFVSDAQRGVHTAAENGGQPVLAVVLGTDEADFADEFEMLVQKDAERGAKADFAAIEAALEGHVGDGFDVEGHVLVAPWGVADERLGLAGECAAVVGNEDHAESCSYGPAFAEGVAYFGDNVEAKGVVAVAYAARAADEHLCLGSAETAESEEGESEFLHGGCSFWSVVENKVVVDNIKECAHTSGGRIVLGALVCVMGSNICCFF